MIAFQDEEGHLRTHPENADLTDQKLGMMVATSPSVTFDGDSYVIAFHSDTGNLWIYSEANGTASNLGRGISRITSPSITALDQGGWLIAFQDDAGHLRTHPDDSALTNRQAGMMALTSPSLARLFEGGWLIAFQDDAGHLRTHPHDTILTNRQAGMDGRTSPSIVDGPLIQ